MPPCSEIASRYHSTARRRRLRRVRHFTRTGRVPCTPSRIRVERSAATPSPSPPTPSPFPKVHFRFQIPRTHPVHVSASHAHTDRTTTRGIAWQGAATMSHVGCSMCTQLPTHRYWNGARARGQCGALRPRTFDMSVPRKGRQAYQARAMSKRRVAPDARLACKESLTTSRPSPRLYAPHVARPRAGARHVSSHRFDRPRTPQPRRRRVEQSRHRLSGGLASSRASRAEGHVAIRPRLTWSRAGRVPRRGRGSR